MKIAQIVCTYPPYRGGIGNVAKKFHTKLKERGHEVSTFSPLYRDSVCNVTDEEDGVVRVKPLVRHGNGAFVPSMLFRFRKFDCLILHYPFFGTSELVWLYSFLKPKKQKLYIYSHMDVISNSLAFKILSIPSRLIKASLFRRADKVFCSSFDYVLNSDLKKIYKKNKNKFFEIPFGVDSEFFKQKDKKELNIDQNILFVGGLDKAHYFKGLSNLIKAFSGIKSKNIKLVVVGDGELKPQYLEQCKKLGCSDRVNFVGNVTNDVLARCYDRSDLFVLPSVNRCEAFGLVLLEAMASGLPVIASSLPGVRSVFTHGEQGFFVNRDSVVDLREKIQQILDNNEMRNNMSISARKLAVDKYSWEKIIKKLEQNII